MFQLRRRRFRGARKAFWFGVALIWVGAIATSAQAGCGCDHPPPGWAPVMPAFGSPGKDIGVFADGQSYVIGAEYSVLFYSKETKARAIAVADSPNMLTVSVPLGVMPGPLTLRVTGKGHDTTYSDELFTALPPARRIPSSEGSLEAPEFQLAVAADGTAYVPLDVSNVLDPTQFAFAFANLALRYDVDDVVIYNADGVDLTIFELEVDDPNMHEWGLYFGWDVEGDGGLFGTVYDNKVASSTGAMSDVFTYWRHEFNTYWNAHQPGGSHEIGEDGRHPDGSLHIDHDHLVIAIQGMEAVAAKQTDGGIVESLAPLAPGVHTTNMLWASVHTELPLDPSQMAQALQQASEQEIPVLIEADVQPAGGIGAVEWMLAPTTDLETTTLKLIQ